MTIFYGVLDNVKTEEPYRYIQGEKMEVFTKAKRGLRRRALEKYLEKRGMPDDKLSSMDFEELETLGSKMRKLERKEARLLEKLGADHDADSESFLLNITDSMMEKDYGSFEEAEELAEDTDSNGKENEKPDFIDIDDPEIRDRVVDAVRGLSTYDGGKRIELKSRKLDDCFDIQGDEEVRVTEEMVSGEKEGIDLSVSEDAEETGKRDGKKEEASEGNEGDGDSGRDTEDPSAEEKEESEDSEKVPDGEKEEDISEEKNGTGSEGSDRKEKEIDIEDVSTDGEETGFVCPVCKKVIRTERGFRIHVGKKHKESKEDILSEIDELFQKGEVDGYPCRKCEKVFGTWRGLKKHMEEHN